MQCSSRFPGVTPERLQPNPRVRSQPSLEHSAEGPDHSLILVDFGRPSPFAQLAQLPALLAARFPGCRLEAGRSTLGLGVRMQERVMGLFSEVLDNLIRGRFGKDESGRLVFLPFGPRRPGYYVDAADEYKITSLVKLYAVAGALINLVGSVAAFALSQALLFDHRSGPLLKKLETSIVVYSICAVLLYLAPALILWNVYREVMAGLCSLLATVGPESIRPIKRSSRLRTLLVIIAAGFMVIAIGIFVAVSYRP
jgi:hypothetical protein